MMVNLTRGAKPKPDAKFFADPNTNITQEVAISLADETKRQLCLDLLQEFGADRVQEQNGELRHNCTLPFGGHSDGNSMAASVNYRRLQFNCYVCGNAGSLQWWVAANRGLDTEQVGAWLRSKAGVGNGESLATRLRIIEAILHPPADHEPIPVYNDRILARFRKWQQHPYLTDPWTPDGLGRGIPVENLERYEVGYVEEDPDFHYYRRIIFPARWEGKLVGWQARALDPDDPEYTIKYKNTPSFPRDRILYGLERRGHAVVVESPMSVLRHAHQRVIAATFGAKLTQTQLRLLESYDTLTLFPDPDKAGYQWARKISNSLNRSMRINIVTPIYSKVDAADLDDDTFSNLCDAAVPAAIWQPKFYNQLTEYKGAS